VRSQFLHVSGDDGTIYFTGYLAVSPVAEYAGMALDGPRFRLAIEAVSDEILLDQAGSIESKGAAGETAGALMTTLVTRTGQTTLATQAVALNAVVSEFAPYAGSIWSKSAGLIANQARAAYRAANG
jgi:hypothetical protein